VLDKVVLICGLSCVGKTLGGEILAADFGLVHAEASAAMRLLWRGSESFLSLEAFAERSLSEDPSRVPVAIIKRTHGIGSLVVSGLRAPREVEVFASAARDVQLVFVRADPAERLRRCLARGRRGHPRDARDLLELDRVQERMGLNDLAELPRAACVANNGTIDEYRSRLRALIQL
jgi:hypothetical protein